MLLIANKSDLSYKRTVTQNEGMDLAKSFRCQYPLFFSFSFFLLLYVFFIFFDTYVYTLKQALRTESMLMKLSSN